MFGKYTELMRFMQIDTKGVSDRAQQNEAENQGFSPILIQYRTVVWGMIRVLLFHGFKRWFSG